MKKLLLIPLIAMLVGCGGGASPTPTPEPKEDLTESIFNKNMIHYLGRTSELSSGVKFAMTCSGFEFKVDIKDETNIINAELNSTTDSSYQNQYAYVFVDGNQPQEKLTINRSKTNYVLAENLSLGMHHIRFVKLNEGCFSSITLKGLTFEGSKWSKWDIKYDKKIEFYGDSITCGYGCEATTSDKFSLETENGAKTYGYTCAKELGYEPSFCSQSGISLYMNYWDSPIHFEDIYETYDTVNKFDNSKYQIDIAVIALGTNDNTKFNTLSKNKQLEEIENILKKYKELSDKIKTNSPNCQIFFAYNMMVTQNGYLDTAIKGTCIYLNNKYGEETAYRYEFSPNTGGADGHPGQAAHIANGKILADFIKNPYDIDE